jgi:pimeloyl-ACP methyl ester carboxylesterase
LIAFQDSLLDGQLLRTIGHCTYGGAEWGECLAAAATIAPGDRESWYRAWMSLADRTFAAAVASQEAGHRVSARSAYLRASNYYRNAYVLHLESPLPDAVREAYHRHRDAFGKAAGLMALPPERLAIPFGDTTLPACFCPAGPERRPVVIAVGGYDSTAEESYFWNGSASVARGYHCVLFDGPGQGELLIDRGIPFRPDWEGVISAVIDAVAGRPDVDASRIVVIGESWGGYLVPRAAARDRRMAACVLDPAQISLFKAFLARLPLPASLKASLPQGPRWLVAFLRVLLGRLARQLTAGWAIRRGMLTHGVSSPWEYFVDTQRYDLSEIIGQIQCPTLVCDAANDDVSAFAKPFFDQLRREKTYLRFTADEGSAEHCIMGNRAVYHERIFDWLGVRLGVEAQESTGGRDRPSLRSAGHVGANTAS